MLMKIRHQINQIKTIEHIYVRGHKYVMTGVQSMHLCPGTYTLLSLLLLLLGGIEEMKTEIMATK